MKKSKNLDILTIKNKIREIHKDFIQTVGCLPEKVDAENVLLLTMVSAKLSAILLCFKEEEVIDKFVPRQNSLESIDYILNKNGYHSSVIISTDGRDIVFRNDNFLIQSDCFATLKKRIVIDDIEKFDWEQFSVSLLEYIHGTIYNRKESLNAKYFKS